MKNLMTPAGIEPATFRFVAQRLLSLCQRGPNIKMYVKEIVWEYVDWLDMPHDSQVAAVVCAVTNIWVQENAGNILTS